MTYATGSTSGVCKVSAKPVDARVCIQGESSSNHLADTWTIAACNSIHQCRLLLVLLWAMWQMMAAIMQRQVASGVRLTDGHRCTGAFTCTMPGPFLCCCPTASLPLLSFRLLLEEYLIRCGLVLAADEEGGKFGVGGVSALGVEDCD